MQFSIFSFIKLDINKIDVMHLNFRRTKAQKHRAGLSHWSGRWFCSENASQICWDRHFVRSKHEGLQDLRFKCSVQKYGHGRACEEYFCYFGEADRQARIYRKCKINILVSDQFDCITWRILVNKLRVDGFCGVGG